MTAPHPFTPDVHGEPGYRPRCRLCGAERHIPAPRDSADNTKETSKR